MVGWIERSFNPAEGRAFAPHRGDLVVRQVELTGPDANNRWFLTGLITNRADHPWRVGTLEVRFQAADGSLLDVVHPPVDPPFVVEPGREVAFRVKLGELPDATRAAPMEARVYSARDETLPPKD